MHDYQQYMHGYQQYMHGYQQYMHDYQQYMHGYHQYKRTLVLTQLPPVHANLCPDRGSVFLPDRSSVVQPPVHISLGPERGSVLLSDSTSVVQALCMAATSICKLLLRIGHWRRRGTERLPAWLWTLQPMLVQSTIISCVIHTTRYGHAGADLRVVLVHIYLELLLDIQASFKTPNGNGFYVSLC